MSTLTEIFWSLVYGATATSPCYFIVDGRTCFITSMLMPIACGQHAKDGQSGRQDFALVDGVGL